MVTTEPGSCVLHRWQAHEAGCASFIAFLTATHRVLHLQRTLPHAYIQTHTRTHTWADPSGEPGPDTRMSVHTRANTHVVASPH